MRFYLIIPAEEAQATDGTDTHWLLPGEVNDRWTRDYQGACGRSVLGSVAITYKAELVTCEACLLELLAQHLKDEVTRTDFDAGINAILRRYK